MKTIELNKTVGLVEVDTQLKGWKIKANGLGVSYPRKPYFVTHHNLPRGQWKILSLHSEMTEEKLEKTDIMPFEIMTQYVLEPTKWFFDYLVGFYNCETRLESYHSWIKSLGYVTNIDVPKCGCHGPSDLGECPACDEWVEAQKQVVELVILIKEG